MGLFRKKKVSKLDNLREVSLFFSRLSTRNDANEKFKIACIFASCVLNSYSVEEDTSEEEMDQLLDKTINEYTSVFFGSETNTSSDTVVDNYPISGSFKLSEAHPYLWDVEDT